MAGRAQGKASRPAPPETIFGKPVESVAEGVRAFKQTDTLHSWDKRKRLWVPVKRNRIWTSGPPARRAGGKRGIGATDRPVTLAADVTANDSDKTFTVPAGEDWEVLSIYAELVSTATVGNRLINLRVLDAAGVAVARIVSMIVQAASLTIFYTFGPGFPAATTVGQGGIVSIPLLPNLVVPTGGSLRVNDNSNIDGAADDLTVRIFGVQRTR